MASILPNMTYRYSRLLLLASLLAACRSSQPSATPPTIDPAPTNPAPLGPTVPPPRTIAEAATATATPPVDPNTAVRFSTAINAFNADLYAKLKVARGNIFYSPTSIEIALAMTAAGARGDTASQMQTVLHLPSDSASAGAAQLLSAWSQPSTSGPTITIANRLWGQKDYAFLPDYLRMTRDICGAELAKVDYKNGSEKARSTINDWVAQATNQKILNMIPAGTLSRSTRLVLTNAVYFKGTWAIKFKARATQSAPFKTASGSVTVPMMHETFPTARYTENAHAQIISLPYKGDPTHALSMIIALPKPGVKLANLEADVWATAVTKWIESMSGATVSVSLPRFKTSAQFELGDTLKQMGMPLAFSDEADFWGMATKGEEALEISSVIHKAFVDVNEDGTEAAAATGLELRAQRLIEDVKPPIEMKIDHEFLFFIRDDQSGAIVFTGRIEDPTK